MMVPGELLQALFSVQSLYEDTDFQVKITRSEFEELASSIFARVMIPVNKALADAKVSASELDAVVPFGGVSRIPKIQDVLLAGLQRESLNKSVNSDEVSLRLSISQNHQKESVYRLGNKNAALGRGQQKGKGRTSSMLPLSSSFFF